MFKALLIIFLVFALTPVVLGKASLTPFADALKTPTLDNLKSAFLKLMTDDLNFYKDLFTPLTNRLLELFQQRIKKAI